VHQHQRIRRARARHPGVFASTSFADCAAVPYNRRVVHDVGTSQVGGGATVLLALLWASSVLVVVAGHVMGSTSHVVSRIEDRRLGGHDYHLPVLGLLAAVGLAGMDTRARGGQT